MTLSDTTVNDLTPISGIAREREGEREREREGRSVMIDRPLRQDDILTLRLGKENCKTGSAKRETTKRKNREALFFFLKPGILKK